MILDQKLELMDDDQNPTESLNLEELKEALLTHICTENKAFFKSQQRDEAELNYNDRKEIASSILETSHSKFLQRFGMNLKKEHLKFFESQSYMNENEKCKVTESVKHICWNLEHHTTIIRNRRYAALLKLIRDKKYFSENEMRSRDPLLYEQLIGQYQSPAEKRANRRPDAKTDTLVDELITI
ncbi:CLUMA_CG014669, isoform A [Clunio marinus]|uniref:CLUMA_CG014669, isoform A n=1 Tax=Clunio marinus TaxID=568069 RepID=A0A1J1IMY2_9DIPT|nr:CLUMA_CG014669, isoform A [Clunio marinus]